MRLLPSHGGTVESLHLQPGDLAVVLERSKNKGEKNKRRLVTIGEPPIDSKEKTHFPRITTTDVVTGAQKDYSSSYLDFQRPGIVDWLKARFITQRRRHSS